MADSSTLSVSSTGQPSSLNTSPVPNTDQVVSGRSNAPLQSTAGQELENQTKQQPSAPSSAESNDLNEKIEQRQELEQVKKLAAIDRDVRAHEAAHAAAGGSLAGSPNLSFTRGPDGRLYATGGEVSIDTSPVSNDPEATIQKAQTIIQAALAPARPSPQDIQVAAQAQALLVDAQAEVLRQGAEIRSEAAAGIASEVESVEDAEQQQEDPNSPSAIEKNRDSIQDSLERSREQREAFAEQLQELNRRLSDVQQKLIDIGAIDSPNSQGSFLDLVV
ncbi:MAG: putative metalloprotease CJM1_0395 family protein [Motiliproteus sp.]